MRWPLPWPKSWREGTPHREDEEEEEPRSLRKSVILFARDLAVAFLVVALVLGALWAYTGVWPPMVVVESGSMQHSNVDSYIGVIDTGDLVLTQAINSPADVVTYVQGRVSGYETYGNYGDVIVFHSPSNPEATPIIHRAMVYVEPDPSGLGFDAPSLTALPAGDWSGVLWNDSAATTPYQLRSVTLLNVSAWNGGVFGLEGLTFNQVPGMVAGFLTHGDHNPAYFDPHGAVSVSRIIGKARGELPWFGLLKLTLSPGPTGCCRWWGDTDSSRGAPKNSWDALLVSLVAIIVLPFVADFAWGFYKDRQKRKRREARLAVEAAAAELRGPPPESTEPPVAEGPPEKESPSEPEPPRTENAPEPTGEAPADEPRTESSEPGDGGREGP